MNKLWPQSWVAALLVAVSATLAAPAWADPPYRVMQLAHASGTVSFQPASTDDWLRATPNRPLVPGDALWVDDGARAELRTTGAALRLGEHTSVALLNLDDRIAQLRLSQGTLILSVRRIGPGQVIEVDTPNLAFRPDRPGLYRIDVAPSGEWTDVTLRRGAARAFGEGHAFSLAEGRTLRFYGSDLADHDSFALGPRDAFDRWSSERDQRWDNAVASRYVSPDLIGYEDLDGHGRWQRHAQYGTVWIPERLPAGWAPYRDGHWAWIEPWGWTWIDDAPWGFAPSHYGRWTRVDTAWAWVPGPVRVRPVYAPAMVQFVGSGAGVGAQVGASFSVGGVAAVAWFALGPQEVYRPAYTVSRDYLRAVNVGNALIAPARITNITVNNTQVTNVYVNPRQGALVAMPAADFARSRPVPPAALRVAPQDLLRAPVASAPPARPTLASIVGAAPPAAQRPPRDSAERRVIARAAPPAVLAPRLAEPDRARPDDAARAPVPAAQRRPAPEVRVVQGPATAVPLPRTEGRGDRRRDERPLAQAPQLPPGRPMPAGPGPQAQAPAQPPAPQQPVPPQAQHRAPQAQQARQAEQAQQRALQQAQEQASRQAQQQAQQQAQRQQAEQQSQRQAQQQAQRQQAEQQAQRQAHQQAQRQQAEQQSQRQAQQQAQRQQAEQQSQRQAQQQAQRQQAEQQAQRQAQQQAQRQQAEQQAQRQAQQQAQRQQAEQQAQRQAQQQAQRQQAEQQAQRQAQQQAQRQQAEQQAQRRRDEARPAPPAARDEPPRGQARAPAAPPAAPAVAQPPHPHAPAEPPRPQARLEPPHPHAPPAPPRQEARAEPPHRAPPAAEPHRPAPPPHAEAPRDQRAAAEEPRKNGPDRPPREKGRHRDEG